MTEATVKMDLNTAEQVRGRLVSAVNEAEAVIAKTAYSSPIVEGQDFAAAIFDADQQLLAQSRRCLGEFVGTLGRGMRSVLKLIPPETLSPGDTLITNDPWLGGGHVPDVLSVRPIFWKDRIVAYAGNIAHVSDLGGKPTPDARDNFEEGLHIPPCRLYRGGVLNEDIMAMIGANSRLPRQVLGDVQAQSAANALMERRVQTVLQDKGLADLDDLSRDLQARAERVMRERIQRMPDGLYLGSATSDGIGEPIQIETQITISGSDVSVAFEGTSPESRWGINVPFNLTVAETLYALRVLLGPDIPLLEGSFRPFSVTAPIGSILNPRPPAPTMVRTIVVHNVCAAVWLALSPLVPDHVVPDRLSAHFGGIWTFRFRGVYRQVPSTYLHGGPSHMSGPYTETYFGSGGMGALANHDGRQTVSMPVNCWNVPIEIMESRAPVVFEEKRLLTDSGGPGRYRGGLGQSVRIQVISDEPVDFIVGNIDRIDHAPFGLRGGEAGAPGQLLIDDETLDRRVPHRMSKGQVVTACMPGGGGFGPPAERDPDAVRRDLELGYVSATMARERYGLDAVPEG
jgi:N-methylhydantoinase B